MDFFYLGGKEKSYYVAGGNNDYGVISDFNIGIDVIAVRSLNGLTLSNLTLDNLGSGTGIFENNELIGFVQGLNADALSLTGDFIALA